MSAIGRRVVLSLTRWSSRIHARYPRRYSGWPSEDQCDFAYGAVTLSGRSFLTCSAITWFCNFPPVPMHRQTVPTTPTWQRHRALAPHRFRLFPFRSPLLGESRLLSFPQVTKMFQFTWLPQPALCVQTGVAGHYPDRVSPFGHPRINVCLATTRGFRRLLRPSSALDTKASTVDPW